MPKTVLPQLEELIVGEAELVTEDAVGVLTEPRDAAVWWFWDVAELDRVAGHDDGFCDAVGALQLREHVAGAEVLVCDDFFW